MQESLKNEESIDELINYLGNRIQVSLSFSHE